MTWSAVLRAAMVADFDLLRDTRCDIRAMPWAEPARREATSYYFGIKRAKEEIVRLNVEITRLLTFMMDSHVDYFLAVQNQIIINPSLAHELSLAWEYQDHIHEAIVRKLVETSKLQGFSGELCVRQRVGRPAITSDRFTPPNWIRLLPNHSTVISSSYTHSLSTVDEGQQEEEDGDSDDGDGEEIVDPDTVLQFLERVGDMETS